MKITHKQLSKIIKEELGTLSEVNTQLSREDAEFAYDSLAVRLRGDDNEVLGKEATVRKLMTDPDAFDDMRTQAMQALTYAHTQTRRALPVASAYWKDMYDTAKEKVNLKEAAMISLHPITNRPASTQKSRWAKLSGISEEHINLSESVTDMTAMEVIIRDRAGEIVDAFGKAMESLWDENTAMMKQQGYTNASQWYSQVGRAEYALEQSLKEAITKAIQEVEAELHDGGYYQDDAFGPGADRDNDGALDADELRDIADDLEG